MTTTEIAQEALGRAVNSPALTNYPAIYDGFLDKGIAKDDIRPRENIFTYHAWRALGRQVRKGEKGVKVITWVPMTKKTKGDNGQEETETRRRPKSATVFHISQTDAIN